MKNVAKKNGAEETVFNLYELGMVFRLCEGQEPFPEETLRPAIKSEWYERMRAES